MTAPSYRFRYNLKLGDTLVHRQTTYQVTDDEDGTRSTGVMVCEMHQQVVSVEAESYRIQFKQIPVQLSGIFEGAPAELLEREGQYTLLGDGSLPELGQSGTNGAFPEQTLPVGAIWNVNGPPEFRYRFEKVESEDGEQIGYIVGEASYQETIDGQSTQVFNQSVNAFSLTYGHQKRGQSVLTSTLENGSKSQTAIELELLERRADSQGVRT